MRCWALGQCFSPLSLCFVICEVGMLTVPTPESGCKDDVEPLYAASLGNCSDDISPALPPGWHRVGCMEAGIARRKPFQKQEELQIQELFSCLLPVRAGLNLKVHLVQMGQGVSEGGQNGGPGPAHPAEHSHCARVQGCPRLRGPNSIPTSPWERFPRHLSSREGRSFPLLLGAEVLQSSRGLSLAFTSQYFGLGFSF